MSRRTTIVSVASGLTAVGVIAGLGVANATGTARPRTVGHSPSASAPAQAAPVTPDEPALGAVPVIRSATQPALPLDPYISSDADIAYLQRGIDYASASCMHRLGFTAWTPADVTSVAPAGVDHDSTTDGFIPYLDPSRVKADGYPLSAKGAGTPAQNTIAPSPSSQARAAYNGSGPRLVNGHRLPVGGCDSAGARQVEPGDGSGAAQMDGRAVLTTAFIDTMADRRVQAVFRKWSACMATSGYSYAEPEQAQSDDRWSGRDSHSVASGIERAVGYKDAQCRTSTNTPGVVWAVEDAYQKRLIVQYHPNLIAGQKRFSIWLGAARQAISEG